MGIEVGREGGECDGQDPGPGSFHQYIDLSCGVCHIYNVTSGGGRAWIIALCV